MIDPKALLSDLRSLVKDLEADLRTRSEEVASVGDALREQHAAAKAADRTALAFEDWRAEQLTQAAVSWVLTSVFVRFLEDNGLVDRPHLSGPGERRQLALDHRQLYFRGNPTLSDREYLQEVFREVGALPGMADLFTSDHVPLWQVGLSGDGAKALVELWHRVDPATGELVHDFRDERWETRFLGDLYQDLSESARKRYALLQTPEFVEELILDRTLEPALVERGLPGLRLIDPTCGSGHFLLGAFARLVDRWAKAEPGTNPRELAQRSLDAVHGVDLNPYAIAITRFRLLVAALRVADCSRLADAPAFRMHLAAGDSLLHGGREEQDIMFAEAHAGGLKHAYASEDLDALWKILRQGRYHVVVGNPPYITVKDPALNRAYRKYSTCHGKYSLAVPFKERFFDLAVGAECKEPAGHVGMITTNSFMKREFGKKVIEEFLPTIDLTHVVDTSGAYVPGHGTPTVILIGRRRSPVAPVVRAVLGIRGEPETPDDPAKGRVWSEIVENLDSPGFEGDFVSVADVPRERFASHPWSLGGGGAAELKERMEAAAAVSLGEIASSIGITSFTLEDDVFLLPPAAARRHRIEPPFTRPMVIGDELRDWAPPVPATVAVFPYEPDFTPIGPDSDARALRYLWPARTSLATSKMFGGKTKVECGLHFYEFGRLTSEKLRTPLSIAFAFVATHNHFVLDRGGKVFNRTAPVIKLPEGSTEEDHLALLGPLNSSTACFWMQQVLHNKGGPGGARSKDEKWHDFYEHDGTKLQQFPLPGNSVAPQARRLDAEAAALDRDLEDIATARIVPRLPALAVARDRGHSRRRRLIAAQEELDWWAYRAYGLLDDDLTHDLDTLPEVDLGERAFEIVLARRVAAGDVETAWFERHGSTPTTTIPELWPQAYRDLVQRRIDLIESGRDIGLIERPEYKRRWSTPPWDDQVRSALASWLERRLEREDLWREPRITTVARLAEEMKRDDDFMRVGALSRDDPDFDVTALVAELVEAASVPFLPELRLKPSGLEKRRRWERTWELQRQEDAIDARTDLPKDHPEHLTKEQARKLKAETVGDIPVPPKYASSDFRKSTWWRLRGKLDVPKETFISYPGCERESDPSLPIAWAGWDHLQQARALSAYYLEMKDQEGCPPERLAPLLAGLRELLPWLRQWHDEPDAEYGTGMGTFFTGFVEEEASALRLAGDTSRGGEMERGLASRPRAAGEGTDVGSCRCPTRRRRCRCRRRPRATPRLARLTEAAKVPEFRFHRRRLATSYRGRPSCSRVLRLSGGDGDLGPQPHHLRARAQPGRPARRTPRDDAEGGLGRR